MTDTEAAPDATADAGTDEMVTVPEQAVRVRLASGRVVTLWERESALSLPSGKTVVTTTFRDTSYILVSRTVFGSDEADALAGRPCATGLRAEQYCDEGGWHRPVVRLRVVTDEDGSPLRVGFDAPSVSCIGLDASGVARAVGLELCRAAKAIEWMEHLIAYDEL